MKFVSYDEANEILATRAVLTLEQWQYIHDSIMALQPGEYRFDETCDDLAFEFLRVTPEQFMPYACGKLFGSLSRSFLTRLSNRVREKKTKEAKC
jgi:hypothetical protein